MRLLAAAAKVKAHLTLWNPRCRVLRIVPTVFSEPNISSIRLLFRWLTS